MNRQFFNVRDSQWIFDWHRWRRSCWEGDELYANRHPPSQQDINIQHQFDNTYADIWEYKAAFLNINFQDYIGSKCLICGKENCYKPIKEYYRYAIDLFSFKKERVPIPRFLCIKINMTFSLLPLQLIPYCQYTVDAVIGTLLKVYEFQRIGRKGYHSASLELDSDCSVTPYLIQTWAVLLLAGFFRGHHILHKKFPLQVSTRPDPRDTIKTIYLYLQSISILDSPDRQSVKSAIRYHFDQTGKLLFGTTSCDRVRPP